MHGTCHHNLNILFPAVSKSHLFPMIVCWYHLRLQIHQPCKHAVQCHRICGHKDHIHCNWISGPWTVAFHCCDSIHNIKPRLHILIQIDQHTCKAVCTWISGMTDCLIFPIDKAIAVFYSACDPFQGMGFHFGKGNDAVCLQKLLWENKFPGLNPLRIIYMHSFCIINNRNLVFFQIGIHAGSLDHLSGGSVTAGICKNNIGIAFLP